MKKAVLISIRPEWVAKILNGEKTIEIRKTAPKCELPIQVYIYCTKGDRYLIDRQVVSNGEYEAITLGDMHDPNKTANITPESKCVLNGKVVAKFTLLRADEFDMENPYEEPASRFLKKACVTIGQARTYANGKRKLYAWRIYNPEIFDKPKELDGFDYLNPGGIRYIGQRLIKGLPKRAPQSWCYVKEKAK